MAGNGVTTRTRSGAKSSPRENKRKKESPCEKKQGKSPVQNVQKENEKKKQCLEESITNKRFTEIIEISSSFRESNLKPSEKRLDKGSKYPIVEESCEHFQEESSDHTLEVAKEICNMKSCFDNLSTHVNNLTKMLHKDPQIFSPAMSPSGVPLQACSLPTPRSSSLSKKIETESTTTRRQGTDRRLFTRELFTPNYQTLSSWNLERKASTVEVPEWMPVAFRPPINMVLNELEAAVAAYIFQSNVRENQSDEEVLIDCSWGYGNRASLKSLFPMRFMDQEVLNMLVSRLTFNEKSITGYSSSWFLPTTFSQYALDWGTSPEQLREWYKRDYMGTIDLLHKIFIPINDNNAHWFLLIVDIRADKLIVLDSFPSVIRKDIGKRLVKRLSLFLEEMLLHTSFYEHTDVENPKISQFEIVVPEGIGEQLAGTNDCGIWVAQWMIECSSCFDDFDKVYVSLSTRMRLAIDLVMHPYNKKKEEIAQRSIRWWTDLHTSRRNLVNTTD